MSTITDLQAELAKLKAENEALKTKKSPKCSLKVSAKGGISLYGMGRFPVTLYKQQWVKLIDMVDEIKVFIKENDSQLTTKE